MPALRVLQALDARPGSSSEEQQAVLEVIDRRPDQGTAALLHERLLRVDRLLRPRAPEAYEGLHDDVLQERGPQHHALRNQHRWRVDLHKRLRDVKDH